MLAKFYNELFSNNMRLVLLTHIIFFFLKHCLRLKVHPNDADRTNNVQRLKLHIEKAQITG